MTAGADFRHMAAIPVAVGDDGALIQELAGYSTGTTSHSLALITHPAGTASRGHHHDLADEVYFVQAGRASLQVDGAMRTLGPGDVAIIRPGQYHKIRNDGPEDLVLVVTCAPAFHAGDVAWDE